MATPKARKSVHPQLPRTPKVRGGKGVVLLGFAGVSFLMAAAYLFGEVLGPLAVWPPVARGVQALDLVGGMRLWGALWFATFLLLVRGAFHHSQTVAMSAFSFMVSIWGISYAIAFVRDLLELGRSGLWLSTGVYAALLLACIGLARMMNTPPLNTDAILKRLKQLEEECPPSAIGGHGAK